MEVPVSEYRRRLAHYHAIAREGEPVYVTERGSPVVKVSTVDDEDVLAQLEAAGVLRRPTAPRPPLEPPVPYHGGPTAEEIIAEQRR